ncbi:hypothetical protein PS631_01324 [Pseudomonas fluorescens]|uniref:HNH nuclease domain-containing protein n=1 Tax=Pseudomonas fluorescens TaxID=294 RepID=A0A5E6R8T2_PSEFL|nr:HNH endonuclease [Pseudomonas fluorescens]VVM61684.1 hypothetical protein PS631_01324 [Pseudomonas fluorescens]
MSMTAAEDEVFTAFLRDKASEIQDAVNYRPNDFLKMLGLMGGYQTAMSLLAKPRVSEGFTRLYLERRLDLSVEALILESLWAGFFDEHLLSSAEERLNQVGYKVVRQKSSLEAFHNSPSKITEVKDEVTADGSGVSNPLFDVGGEYARSDLFTLLGFDPHPSGGKWFNGHVEHLGNHFLFCNIGVVGRTGHDYDNHFAGDQLVWYARNGSRLGQPSISKLLSQDGTVFIFYRNTDRDPFIFAGEAYPVEVVDAADSLPVKVVWGFVSQDYKRAERDLDSSSIVEGAVSVRAIKVYERDRGARLKCISHWGWQCFVCGFDFQKVYGGLGKDFIHVHHLQPISEMGGEYHLDPVQDLRPVCPNCHAMLHRSVPVLTVEELKSQMHLASL